MYQNIVFKVVTRSISPPALGVFNVCHFKEKPVEKIISDFGVVSTMVNLQCILQ